MSNPQQDSSQTTPARTRPSARQDGDFFYSQAKSNYYYNLSLKADKNNKKIKVSHSESHQEFLDKRELLIRAIEINPENTYALNNLSNILSSHEKINIRINDESSLFSKIDLLKLAIEVDSTYANAFCNIGVEMERTGLDHLVLEVEGKEQLLCPKSAYLKALQLNEKHSIAYNNLGLCLLNESETIEVLLNGKIQQLNRQQLFIKSIESDFQNSEAFYNLSTTLKDQEETIGINIEGELLYFNKQSLLKFSVQLNPGHSNAYYNLACSLNARDESSIELFLQGKSLTFNEKSLYLCAIQYNPNNAKAYFNLALALALDKSEKLKIKIDNESREFDKISLLRTAIQKDAGFVEAYYRLALELEHLDSPVDLIIKDTLYRLSKFELLEIILQLDPDHCMAMEEIGKISGGK